MTSTPLLPTAALYHLPIMMRNSTSHKRYFCHANTRQGQERQKQGTHQTTASPPSAKAHLEVQIGARLFTAQAMQNLMLLESGGTKSRLSYARVGGKLRGYDIGCEVSAHGVCDACDARDACVASDTAARWVKNLLLSPALFFDICSPPYPLSAKTSNTSCTGSLFFPEPPLPRLICLPIQSTQMRRQALESSSTFFHRHHRHHPHHHYHYHHHHHYHLTTPHLSIITPSPSTSQTSASAPPHIHLRHP
ncbi:uncharacterized protein IWZ02DRAFT_460736, partial [Phyllosticta citriasiana]|uniref:uncharacterized protein n=1 Tax=Phyllosticta citriasiana TaxID=595635 RepID=UPI0030FDB16B